MFLGEYQHNVDLKGRLIIPSKYREQLGDKMVVTKGLDGCLYLYPQDAWNAILEKLQNLNLLQPGDRKFMRFFVASANECELDKQGRILLSAPLRQAAGIDKDVVLAGMMDRIEIWDKARWDAINDMDDMSNIAQSMALNGISL